MEMSPDFLKIPKLSTKIYVAIYWHDLDSAIWQSNWSTGITTPTQNI